MELCMFSKHLQELNLKEVGGKLKEIGLDGIDLTVRKGGHVEPSQVRDKLPDAVEILSGSGVKISMITTGITEIDQPYARDVIETAASLGIRYFKLGYYLYEGFGTLKKAIAESAAKLKDISELCREKKICAGYHNHSGDFLGASIPNIINMLEKCDPEWVGMYYDIGHAAIEGGSSGWKMNLDQFSDRLFMVAAKDLRFDKSKDTKSSSWKWQVSVVPMGQGLVDWAEFISYLKRIGFNGAFSLHSEYNLSADKVLEQTGKDLRFIKEYL